MATMNPLERKARNSFIKGIVVAGLIGIIGIAILVIQLMNMRADEKERLASLTTIYVLNQDVQSGKTITADMLVAKEIEGTVIPANAVNNINDFYYQDQNGNNVTRTITGELIVTIDGQSYAITENNGAYYADTNNDGNAEQINIYNAEGAVMVAKVSLAKNTILTVETVAKSNEIVEDSTREQEYNVLVLPADVETEDTVDVRLRMPDGTDYIVVSKKTITILDEAGIPSLDTVSLKLTEDEILMMSNAIVEAYQIPGSMLYVTRYVEPGLQAEATTTYVPNSDVQNLIYSNPNIVNEAKTELNNRYNQNADNRNNINDTLGTLDQDDRNSAVESGTNDEITAGQDARQRYLDSLSE